MKRAINVIQDIYQTVGTIEEAFAPFHKVKNPEDHHGDGDDHALLNALFVMRRRHIMVAENKDREAFLDLVRMIKHLPEKGDEPDADIPAGGSDSPK